MIATRRLKQLLERPLQYGAAESGSPYVDGVMVRYIRITDVDQSGRLRDREPQYLPATLAVPYLLRRNDILLARSGATVGKAFLYEGHDGDASFAGYMIRARVDPRVALPRFVYYCLQSDLYWDYVRSFYSQATIQNLNAQLYGNVPIPLPSVIEQAALVEFLDRQTAAANTLIAKYERLIELLEEKRAALVRHAVTEGLDDRVRLKDSGVEWIGSIPSHWRIVPLKYVVSIAGGSTPDKGNDDYWHGGEIPWASAKDLKVETLLDTEDHITELALRSGAVVIPEGCVITVVRGMILARTLPVAVTARAMVINQDLKALQPKRELRTEYLADILRSISSAILARADVAAHGTKVLRSEDWTRFEIPLPPLDEQDAIIASVANQKEWFASLIGLAKKAIALIEERRSALVSACVTGQVDVRSYGRQTRPSIEAAV